MGSHDRERDASVTTADWDAEMAEQLQSLAGDEPEPQGGDLDRLYASVRSRCAAQDETLVGFLRTRATWLRRLLVLAALGLLVFSATRVLPTVAESARGAAWSMTLAAYAVLVLIAVFLATRPVHLPPLASWKAYAVAGLTIAAALVAALFPSAAATAASSTTTDASPLMFMACMGTGLLLGVPVYALLRIFDRGHTFGHLMAAAAAGLVGSLLLNVHCPVQGGAHALLGHASVAVLFVLGLGLVHRWIPSK